MKCQKYSKYDVYKIDGEWKRNCPKCGKFIVYKNRLSCSRSVRKNVRCKSCCKVGTLNPMFDVKRESPFKGHHHTEDNKRKHSNLMSGESSPLFGRKRPNQSKRMMGKNNPSYRTDFEAFDKFQIYKYKARRLTEKQPLHELKYYEKRGLAKKNTDSYHLDHILSLKYGFESGIPIEDISHISNLRFIPWLENLQKGSNIGELNA